MTEITLLYNDKKTCLNSLRNLGVSVHIGMEYMKAAKVGEEIIVDASVIRRGKTLAFLEAEIRNKSNNELLVKGSHTKFLTNPPLAPKASEQKSKL